jgi:hypothetical protein
MKIEATQLEKAVLLKVSGRMDAENANEFELACDQWIAQGAKNLKKSDCGPERPTICQQYGAAFVSFGRSKTEIRFRLPDPLRTARTTQASI